MKKDASGILISCSVGNNSTPVRCSGILFGNNWVVTTGVILSSILNDRQEYSDRQRWIKLLKTSCPYNLVSVQNEIIQKSQVSFSIRYPQEDEKLMPSMERETWKCNSMLFPINQTLKKFIPYYQSKMKSWNFHNKLEYSPAESREHNDSSSNEEGYNESEVNLKYIWKSPLVSESVNTVLSSWLLGSSSSVNENCDDDAESEIAKDLLPVFLILELAENNRATLVDDYNGLMTALRALFESSCVPLKRGQTLVIESTPFGNSCFCNSVSEGIISNVVGSGDSLILTDARTALGCEGGPMFVVGERNKKPKWQLVGIVVCPLSWWKGEWVGFTLGVALQPVLRGLLLSGLPLSGCPSLITPPKSDDKLAVIDDCIVFIRYGYGWGSGIVVDSSEGIILTCSHVVRKAKNNKVLITWKNKKCYGRVLFRCMDDYAYDVAILKAYSILPFKSAVLSQRDPVKGEAVIAAGFPLFSEDDNVRPTVTRGVISHVSDPVAMLQTTCCVQSGASGGAIFKCSGEVVGLISCNTVDTAYGALYPFINMAVPASVLAVPITAFLRTGDIQFLHTLQSPDPIVQKLWKLQSTVSKL